MKVRVIDNFLSPTEFKKIKEIMMGDYLPWYYNRGIINSKERPGRYQLTHVLYANLEEELMSDNYSSVCENLMTKLGVSSKSRIIRIKANMNPQTFFHKNGGYHVDYIDDDEVEKITTAVYYVNTNNGWTHIKGYGKVKCKENRIALFDSRTQHAGFSCTDQDVKVVININYLN